MEEKFQVLEDLNVWIKCREFKNEIIKAARSLPAEEKFILTDQLIRASRSITNNIAEGYGRFHFQENIQYLRQSRGSLYECMDHLYCMLDEGYLNAEKIKKLLKDKSAICLKLLNGYIKYLRDKKLSGN